GCPLDFVAADAGSCLPSPARQGGQSAEGRKLIRDDVRNSRKSSERALIPHPSFLILRRKPHDPVHAEWRGGLGPSAHALEPCRASAGPVWPYGSARKLWSGAVRLLHGARERRGGLGLPVSRRAG